MNKTIIININGIVFHIEEDAYEILKNYMTEVKRHFLNSADSLEITTDIENRIAEMFSELLEREHKQVIVEQDVTVVIEQMGTVADFENAEADPRFAESTYTSKADLRRLFRDPDDHLIAGVCAGIANYFGVDPVWIRLAFALCAPIGGSGFMLYVILWIVVPKAVTRADRMAMKGEKQNLQGFKKNFEDELSSVRANMSNFSTEARPLVYKARDFFADFFHHLGVFFMGTGKVFVKLVGVVILLTCFSMIIFLCVAFIAIICFGNYHFFPGTPFSLMHHHYANAIYISAFLVALVPLLSIIVLTFKGVFNTGGLNRSTGSTALVIWISALCVLIYFSSKIAAEYREGASFTETVNIKPTAGNTYYLKLSDIKYFTAQDSARLNIKNKFHNIQVTDEDDNSEIHNVHINIEKSDVNQPVLVESYSARGYNYDEALLNARNTRYIFGQKDSVLTFDYKLRNIKDELWHGEEVYLTLKLPSNSKVVIDRDVTRILDANVYECNVTNKRNADKLRNATFILTDNGLECKIDTVVTAKKDSVKAGVVPDSVKISR